MIAESLFLVFAVILLAVLATVGTYMLWRGVTRPATRYILMNVETGVFYCGYVDDVVRVWSPVRERAMRFDKDEAESLSRTLLHHGISTIVLKDVNR